MRNKYHFRCCLAPEIVCEGRSHLLSTSASPYYTFSGSKVKGDTEKRVEFEVHRGYLQMRLVDGDGAFPSSRIEDRLKLIPIYYITDIEIVNTSELVAISIRGDVRLYRLKERFGFVTALEKELKCCGVLVDTTKQCEQPPLPEKVPISSPPCFSYRVERLHCPLPALLSHGYSAPWVSSSMKRAASDFKEEKSVIEESEERSVMEESEEKSVIEESEERADNEQSEERPTHEHSEKETPEHPRFLFLTNTAVLEVVEDGGLTVHRAIPFQDILVITAEAADPSALVLQFQSNGFLRTTAFACASRAAFLAALYCFYASAPFHWTLVRTAFRFRGTSLDVKDIQRQCQRELADGATLEVAERLVANSRYFTAFTDWSAEQFREVATRITQAVEQRLADPAREREVLLLLLCVQELTQHVQESLPASAIVAALEPLFTALTHASSTLSDALVFTLSALTVQGVSPRTALASSFLASPALLEFVATAAFTRPSAFTRYSALSVLIQAILQSVALPPPVPLVDAVHPLLCPHLLQLLSLLEEQNAAIQTQLFFLLHALFLHKPSDHLLLLQRRAVDTCRFLQILRCALFDSSPSLQLIARALLALLTQHEPLFLSLLQRIFPREFIRVLQTPHAPTLFRALACGAEEETPTCSSFFVWKEIRQLAFPVECFNLPAFFALCFQDSCSYKLVWGVAQRQELQHCLDREIAVWQSIQVPAHWNDSQFVVLYSAYQRHQVLFGYFFPQLATIPVSFFCSSLCQQLELPFVPTPRPALELPNPALFFVSLYARLLTCDTDASRVTLLKCMRVVFFDTPDLCGEFCDCGKVLEQIALLRTGEVCRQYVRLLQALLLQEGNTAFLVQHAAEVLPVLLQQLALLHCCFDEEHATVLLDVLFHLLAQTTSASSTPLLPLSPVITTLSSPAAIHTLASLLFLPSPTVTAFVARILLHLLTVSQQSEQPVVPSAEQVTGQVAGQIGGQVAGQVTGQVAGQVAGQTAGDTSLQTILLQTPFIDALLLQSAAWMPVHVQLLKTALHRHDLLNGVLPAAVVFALEVVPEPKFCALFGQETRSARLIWTEAMRAHLQHVIHRHVDAYLAALKTEEAPAWEYTPLPPIHYAELDEEVYCGKYYLRYLSEHGVSVVKSPTSLLTSIKNEWIREGKRRGLSMSREEALSILHLQEGELSGVKEGELSGVKENSLKENDVKENSLKENSLKENDANSTEDILNDAYWREWARSDEETRKQLLLALNILTGFAITAAAPIRDRLFLLVRVQCQLYAAGFTRLSAFHYPSFEVLVAQTQNVVEAPAVDLPFLAHLVWLMYLACSCSVENMEAFGSKCGLTVLHNVMLWNEAGVRRNDHASIVVLYYQTALLSLLSQSLSLHALLCGAVEVIEALVCYLVLLLPPVILAAIVDFFTNLAGEAAFRALLLRTRVCLFTTLLPLLFHYDPAAEELIEKDLNEQCLRLSVTLHNSSSRASSVSDLSDFNPSPAPTARADALKSAEESAPVGPESELEKATADSNAVARKVVRLLSLLVSNEASFASLLSPLLTKPLVSLLLEANADDLLTILNSDFYETPFIVWTQAMREQLLAFLQAELTTALTTTSQFLADAPRFVFDAIKDELIIADVYVRIFNEQQPKQFVKDTKYFLGLLAFLRTHREGLQEGGVWVSRYACSVNDTYVRMMLRSLHILLANSPQLADHLRDADDLLVLFGFLQPLRRDGAVAWDLDDPCVEEACAVLELLARTPRLCAMCVDCQAVDILFLTVLQELPARRAQLVALLYAICLHAADRSLTLFNTGLWLFSLHLLLPPAVQVGSAVSPASESLIASAFDNASFTFDSPSAPDNTAMDNTAMDNTSFASKLEDSSSRGLALALLSAWCNDESIKALCRVTLRRFLPEYIVEMICARERVLETLDATTISPECIWDASMRAQACAAIAEQYARFIALYTSNQPYALPDDFEVVYDQIAGERCLGHVFVALYLETPHYHVRRPTQFLDTAVQELREQMTLCVHPTQQSIPCSAEEERRQHQRLLQTGETVCHVLECEDASVTEHFLHEGDLDAVVGLWSKCEATQQLDSVASECCCLVVSRVAESGECLKRVVETDAVLALLLQCLMQGVHHSVMVAKCLNYLFKMKTPEMCEYLERLNVVPRLLSCFDPRIEVRGKDKEEGRRESAEILVTIQQTLLLLAKMPFLKKEVADMLRSSPVLTNDYSYHEVSESE